MIASGRGAIAPLLQAPALGRRSAQVRCQCSACAPPVEAGPEGDVAAPLGSMSVQAFEAHCGREASKKWKESVR